MYNSSTLYFDTCQNLLSLYQNSFGISFSGYEIKNDLSNPPAPITLHSDKTVVLRCNINCQSQIVFQLSHELCHAAVSKNVKNSLRWFEEVLAVLSSFIFPLELSTIDKKKYIGYFKSSISDCLCECFKDSSMDLNEKILKELEAGSGTNNYNDYGSYWNVAQKLLPVIDCSSDIWKCVPYLAAVPCELSFADSLDKWQEISPLKVRNSISIIKSALLFR